MEWLTAPLQHGSDRADLGSLRGAPVHAGSAVIRQATLLSTVCATDRKQVRDPARRSSELIRALGRLRYTEGQGHCRADSPWYRAHNAR